MDPRHLIQLAVILDKGSITAAATHLRMTQPTLTRNVSTLEMQAGQPLFFAKSVWRSQHTYGRGLGTSRSRDRTTDGAL